jgi:hypothetical protein
VPHPEGDPEAARMTVAPRSDARNKPQCCTKPPGLGPGNRWEPPKCTTMEAGGKSTGASRARIGMAATLLLTKARIGNQGRGVKGTGYGTV